MCAAIVLFFIPRVDILFLSTAKYTTSMCIRYSTRILIKIVVVVMCDESESD